MTGSSKRKGDEGEREAAGLIADMLGVPARRYLGAGRLDDVGDIDGVPNTTIQVVARGTDVVAVGVVRKPLEAEMQRMRAGTDFAATFVRIRGGTWRVVLTVEQWAAMWREATGPPARPVTRLKTKPPPEPTWVQLQFPPDGA